MLTGGWILLDVTGEPISFAGLGLIYIRVKFNVRFQSIPVLAQMVEGTRRKWKYPSSTSPHLHFMNAVSTFQPRAVRSIQLLYPGRPGASNQILQIAEKHLCPEMIAGQAAMAAMEN
ncbi:hypothetical protein A6P08_10475 [Acidithiobacillus thiooxidans]|nr:hypothetical protein A6P08_10475 [Acidithiobacillus thiooxidans]